MSVDRIKLKNVRAAFRLLGEIRELGSDPQLWRPHMINGLRRVVPADLVISSEVYFLETDTPGITRVVDIGWGSDFDQNPWHIHTERDERPEAYMLSAIESSKRSAAATATTGRDPIRVKPERPLRGGKSFILSQYNLTHIGGVDQLGLHRVSFDDPFTPAETRLVRLFHIELGRLLRADAMRRARDPAHELPPRLRQTLEFLLQGQSEKQIAYELSLSPHTIHNYIKALHQRFGVSSRAELIAKAAHKSDFHPKLSLEVPQGPVHAGGGSGTQSK